MHPDRRYRHMATSWAISSTMTPKISRPRGRDEDGCLCALVPRPLVKARQSERSQVESRTSDETEPTRSRARRHPGVCAVCPVCIPPPVPEVVRVGCNIAASSSSPRSRQTSSTSGPGPNTIVFRLRHSTGLSVSTNMDAPGTFVS